MSHELELRIFLSYISQWVLFYDYLIRFFFLLDVNLHYCTPVVVLKHELSYKLAELFNKCLKESCFPDCWKVSLVVPVFKNVGERSIAKNYRPVTPLSVVAKSLINL